MPIMKLPLKPSLPAALACLMFFAGLAAGADSDIASRYVTESGWRTVFVEAKKVDIYYPQGVERAEALRPVIYLHGHSGATLHGRRAFEKMAADHGFVLICPQGGVSWWTDRPHASFDSELSAEDFIIEYLVPYVREYLDPRVRAKTLAIAGISMGGQGALRLAFRHPDVFPIVFSIAAAIRYDSVYGSWEEIAQLYGSREEAEADTAAHHIDSGRRPWKIGLYIDPADEDWIEGNYEFQQALAAKGVVHEYDFRTTGGGHTWTYFYATAPKMGRFLADAFEQLAPLRGGSVIEEVSLE